ncbi:MAG: hypothetical protein CUN54_10510, partial [Phototrophicales bacterium]
AVNSFDFGGLSANQTGIDNFNQQLAANLARAAANNRNQAEVTAILITDDSFAITIRTPRRR